MDGFEDASAVLSAGVYVLLHQGQAVFVGKAKGPVLMRLYAHRTASAKGLPSWMPVKGFVFDQVLVRRCKPEEAEGLLAQALQTFQPMAGAA